MTEQPTRADHIVRQILLGWRWFPENRKQNHMSKLNGYYVFINSLPLLEVCNHYKCVAVKQS